MIISYCINPNCTKPKNHPKLRSCQTCGRPLILHNRYRVIKKIGQGGFGATFMGVDLTIQGNPLCVVKQLRPAIDNPDAFQMALDLFKREAKTLGKISHPQIPKLLNYFVEDQQFYLIQDLIKGKNLRSEVKSNGTFKEIAVKHFLAEMLPIIKYIHELKIIHRDIKPANILRRQKDGKLLLIDFGAVKDQVNTQLAQTYGQGQTALTKFAVGTIGFAPPEQIAMRPIFASDIYALGASCIYLLTGQSPKNIQRDPNTGALIWENEIQISSSLSKILKKMLEPDVRNRFRTAQEVIDALGIVPIEQSLSQNLMTKSVSEASSSRPKRLPNSQITSTSTTSVTEKLQQAVEERRNPQKLPNLSIKWDEETFLSAYRNGKTDFNKQDLSKLNLNKFQLSKFNFKNCNLEKASFKEADLHKANLYGANLGKAILSQVNFRKAYLSKSKLTDADLQEANLTEADLTDADLQRANLFGANLKNAIVKPEQLKLAKTNWKTIYPDGKRKWWKFFFRGPN